MKFVFQVFLLFSCQLFSIQTGPLQIFAESNRIIKEKCVLAFPEFFLKDWNAVGGLHKKGIFCHCEMASNRVVAVCGKSKVIVCKSSLIFEKCSKVRSNLVTVSAPF